MKFVALTTQKGVWESVTSHSHIIESHESCHMISHGKSHNKYRKVVHKHCISSVENLIGTPSSSCQLRLGVGLSRLG